MAKLNQKIKTINHKDYNFLYDSIVSYGEKISTTIVSSYLNYIGIKNTLVSSCEIIKTDYNYRDAILPIYDIVGSKSIDSKQPDANSYSGAMTYANLIQQRFSVKEKQEASNSLSYLIDTPLNNGIDVKFTNKLPTDDLENPTRTYNAPQ